MAAGSEIGALFVKIGADITGLKAGMDESESALEGFSGKIANVIKAMGLFGLALAGITAGFVLGVKELYDFAKQAGDFQTKITGLKTGAGELQSNLGMVSQGILKMSGQVGQSANDLADGMFMIESAGFHGAAGLQVLQAAAEGAKVGQASLATVADAVTTVLGDYNLGANRAADATNFLVAVVAQGKTHMEDLAGSLAHVLPFASALKIPLDQIGGALATMTAKGIPAADAATYLRFTMAALANETPKGTTALKEIGLTSQEVSSTLTSKGLLPALVLIQEQLAKKFPEGGAKMFAALSDIVGGTRGLGAALQLTGTNLSTFITATKNVSDQIKAGHGQVLGWSEVQKDFNFQMDKGKAALEAAAISLGTKLLPVLTDLMQKLTPLIPVVAQMASNLLDKLLPPTIQFVGWLTTLGPELTTATNTIKSLAPYIATLAAAWTIWNIALAVTKVIQMGILAVQFATGIYAIVSQVGLWTAAQWLLNVALSANPIGVVVIAIAALVAGFIFAYTHCQPFRDFVNMLWGDLKSFAGWIYSVFAPQIESLGNLFSAIGSGVQGITSAAHNAHIPGFATGGIVPGAIGAPMLAVVHGGEQVLTPAQQAMGGGGVNVTVAAPAPVRVTNSHDMLAALYSLMQEAEYSRSRGNRGY